MNGCHGKTVLLWLKAEEGTRILAELPQCARSCKELPCTFILARSKLRSGAYPSYSEKSSLLTASGNTQLELGKSAEN